MGLEFWICAGHGVLLAKAGTGQQHISKTEIFFFSLGKTRENHLEKADFLAHNS
jgi:hypothetical protein